MKFEDMVPLIIHLTQLREAKKLAEAQLRMAEARQIAMKPVEAKPALDRATDAWFAAWQETEKAWDEVLKPLGLTRQDLRMAAL